MLNNQERNGAFAQCNDSVALLKINARIYIQSSGKCVAIQYTVAIKEYCGLWYHLCQGLFGFCSLK